MLFRICYGDENMCQFYQCHGQIFFYVSLIMTPLFASQLLVKVSDREKMRHFVKKAGI